MNKRLLCLAVVIYSVSGYATATNVTPFDELKYRRDNTPFINVDTKIIKHFNNIYSKSDNNFKIEKTKSMQAIAVICQAVLAGQERQDISYSLDELGIDINGKGNEITQDKSERIMGVLIRDYLRILKEKYNAKNDYKLFWKNVYSDLKNYEKITHSKSQKDLLYVLKWLDKKDKDTGSIYCNSIVRWIKFLEIEKLFTNLFGHNMENMDEAPPISINLNNNQQNQQLIKENKVIFKKIERPNWYLGNKNQTIGLNNIGATCYMNATLQCLAHVKPLSEWILRNKDKLQDSKMKGTLIYDYSKVLEKLWYIKTGADGEPSEKSFSPNDFKDRISTLNPLFAGVQANDSKDLINFMLERLHNELNQPQENNNSQNAIINQLDEKEALDAFRQEYFSKNQSSIVDNFYGITEASTLCLGCIRAKYNFQIYSFLEFPLLEAKKYRLFLKYKNLNWLLLPGEPTQDYPQNNILKQMWNDYTLTLEDCLEYYRKIDMMIGQNQMYCNMCNGNRDTSYRTRIYSAPETLIINLNRGKGAVNQIPIKIPATLDLHNYIADEQNDGKYYLSGIVSHFGPSSMGGHFIAHCRDNELDASWTKYNDGIVEPDSSTQKAIGGGMPYILFYSKKKPMKQLQNHINTPYSQGLDNIGYTCYMNSAVQLLSHIKPISEYILQLKENNWLSKNLHPIAYQYANLLEEIWFGNKSFAPKEFQHSVEVTAKKPQYGYDFGLRRHNDACDFLRGLVQILHDELNVAPQQNTNQSLPNPTDLNSVRNVETIRYLDNERSILTDKITHSLYTEQKCQNKACGYTTYNYQFSNITTFDMWNVKKNEAKKLNVTPENVRELSIMKCVEEFKQETLAVGGNSKVCDKCKGHYNISNRTILNQLGENWIVDLDYGKNKQSYTGNFKLDENINLGKIFKETANKSGEYYLSGIIMHIGTGKDIGHYVAFSRMGKGGDWYEYNDNIVTKVDDFKSIVDSFMQGNYRIPRMLVYTAVPDPDVKGQVNANQSQPQQQSLNNIKEQEFNEIKKKVEQNYNVTRLDNTKGLLNPKNRSCYINSVLQCLIHIKPLTTKLLADRIQEKLNPLDNDTKNLINSEDENAKNAIIQRQESKKLVLRAYTDLLTDVYSRTENTCSDPTTLINLLNRVDSESVVKINAPGDAKDFCRIFMEKIQNETSNPHRNDKKNDKETIVDQTNETAVLSNFLENTFLKDASLVTDVFTYIKRSVTCCQKCGATQYSFQHDKQVLFPLNEIKSYFQNNGVFFSQDMVTLDQCFAWLNKTDTHQNVYCSQCKNSGITQNMQEQIYSTPNVFVIVLNRGTGNNRVKTSIMPYDSFDLSKTEYIVKKTSNEQYFLVGILFHHGESGASAHYTSLCRNDMNGKWYYYNDNVVTEVGDFNKGIASNRYGLPYMLFYQKINWTLQ